jgi:hypothetical protein
MKRRLVPLQSIFWLALIAACSPATQGSPFVWIDAPLDGSILPLAPYPVVAHASSPDGIARFAFRVNDDPAVECAADTPGASGDGTISACLLSHVNSFGDRVPINLHATWSPSAPGKFSLQIRAQNTQGIWGAYAEANVTVGGETPTPTAAPSENASPSATVTLTATPTLTLTPAGLIFSPGISTNEFHYVAQNVPQCSPLDLFLTVKVSDPGRVKGMLLFFHLEDQAGGGSTGWNNGVSMNRLTDGSYSLSVSSDSIPGYTDYLKAWFIYQFVAMDSGGKPLARSEVYRDTTLSMCPM